MKITRAILILCLLSIGIFEVFAQILPEKPADLQAKDLEEKGFGIQTTKISSTSSVAEVGAETLSMFNHLNPTNSLFGTLAGLTVQSNAGNATAGATLQIRGMASPLVYIDGVQRPLSTLSVDEIEKITVLKDASALALYGMRGSNGVILVTTKRGKLEKMSVQVNYRRGIYQPIRPVTMANAGNYAVAMNEALRNDGLPEKYSSDEIQKFRDGSDPYNYPNVNWQNQMLRNNGSMNELGVVFRGGTERMRYYSALHYNNDWGLIQDLPSYSTLKSTRPSYNRLNARTNLDIKITNSTFAKINVFASMDENNVITKGPGAIYADVHAIPAAAFPVKRASGNWGGNLIYTNRNPYAAATTMGFARYHSRNVSTDLTLLQDLSDFVKGLNAEVKVAYDNDIEYFDQHASQFEYETANGQVYGSEIPLAFTTSMNALYFRTLMSGKLNYNTIIIDDHSINANLLYVQETWKIKERNNKNAFQDFIGSVNYGYQDRLFVDFTGAYSGSSYLSKGNRFRFFPTLSAAWIISNEDFWQQNKINSLKLRASAGILGNGQLSYELDKQYYQGGANYYFTSANSATSTIREGDFAAIGLQPVISKKINVGVDAVLINNLTLNIDFFYDRRDGSQTSTESVYSSLLGLTPPLTFTGVNDFTGVDVSVDYSGTFGDIKYSVGGIFAFVKTTVVENGIKNIPYDYLNRIGKSRSQFFGLQADGFFNSWDEINDAPKQLYSEVRPGDIRYVDQNDDDVIDDHDMIAMGYSTQTPEINYGLNFNVEYKGLGIAAIFQGIKNYSVLLNTPNVYWPLRNDGNISDWYLGNNHWSASNMESPEYPRLTTLNNENNYRANSIWMADGSYLKLRALTVHYTLPSAITKKIKMDKIKIYLKGNDLFSVDHIKIRDPEAIAIGLPTVSSYHIGASFEF
ncbi:MAG: SusC/RagA family TonB-linked outer membrane protein [Bacteroidales bacterium]